METPVLKNALSKIWSNPSNYPHNNILRREMDIEAQRRIMSIFAVGDFYFYIANIWNSEFEYFSPEIEQVLGYAPGDMNMARFLDIIHPDDKPFLMNAENTILRFFSKLKPEQLFHYKTRYDYRVRTRQGNYKRILQQVVRLVVGSDGTVIQSFGTHIDITALKKDNRRNLSIIGFNGEPSYFDIPLEPFQVKGYTTFFTPREREIISGLWEGEDSKEIGEKLKISKDTVDTHRRKLLKKAGVKNTIELVRFALAKGEI